MKKIILIFIFIPVLFGESLTEKTLKTRGLLNDLALELLSENPQYEVIAQKKHLLHSLKLSFWTPDLISFEKNSETAWCVGRLRAELNHHLATQMIQGVLHDDFTLAQEARALIELPRHANTEEGSIALSEFKKTTSRKKEFLELLAKEYGLSQTTRIHETLDSLSKIKSFSSPLLIAQRAGEIQGLSSFPEIVSAYFPKTSHPYLSPSHELELQLTLALTAHFSEQFPIFKNTVLSRLPLLIDPPEITRREKMILKLIRLVPKEYRAGVRDGILIVPLEYRHAKSFASQSQSIAAELTPFWQQDPQKKAALMRLDQSMNDLSSFMESKSSIEKIQEITHDIMKIMENEMGIVAKKSGKSKVVLEESYLEIRQSLRRSLMCALQGDWRDAESARQEAYTTFDLEIEMRLLPRDPDLAQQTERQFLGGSFNELGIKAVLDAREKPEKLQKSYDHLFEELEKTEIAFQVGVSPAMIILSTISIFSREGLEAVTILAALLAGFRGNHPTQIKTKRRIITGVWLALVTSLLTFGLMQYVVQSLSRYGEVLEAAISVLAVITLLFVSNWVFHKYYWVQWNSTLRQLGKKANLSRNTRWENAAMIGVGFLTIYREGFEISLFLQTLILEGGWGPVLVGIACGTGIVSIVGFLIFKLGSKLPYRKLLVMTGGLVVLLLMTFTGSTVRLFQTVGWMPIHPFQSFDLPHWIGVALGIYPSWEGIIAPFVVVTYIGGAWLFVKIRSHYQHSRPKSTDFHPLSPEGLK